jgi:hypothetical protein
VHMRTYVMTGIYSVGMKHKWEELWKNCKVLYLFWAFLETL